MYNKQSHIHFVGIGGIGMSGIAKILTHQGYQITGCDTDHEQQCIKDLKSLGCAIYEGNNTVFCADPTIDILVYSSAIKDSNPEIAAARTKRIPTISRALMLAELMRTKFSIAIAGSHGKTTTTSLISHILIENENDPTVIIGGHLKSLSSNARLGKGDFLVAEADESDRSLTRLHATLAVVTNIDLEHLDVYKDIDDIKATFKIFLDNLPFYGKAILCHEDKNTMSLLPLLTTKAKTYGLSNEADLYATDIELNSDHAKCTVWQKGQEKPLGVLTSRMPGIHNILNALAATAVTQELGLPFEAITKAIANFKGVDRRFTYKGTYLEAEIFDDYGHHPVEIHHTLKIARARSHKKLIVLFQPHRYSRTFHLWEQFIQTFTENPPDHLIITDIYAASETPLPTITSQRLCQDIKARLPGINVEYVALDSGYENIKQSLDLLVNKDDLVLFLGAGKINKLADKLQNTHTGDREIPQQNAL